MELFGLLYLLGFGLWIYAIISVLMNEFKNNTNKIIWIIVLIFLPVSAVLYPFIGKSQIKRDV